MAFGDKDRLRQILGEAIPADGSEGDTMFTDAQIDDFLAQSGNDLTKAAVLGWQVKAAEYANLVDVAEGNSSRAMSDLHKNALAMVKYYSDDTSYGPGGTNRTVVIGDIARRR